MDGVECDARYSLAEAADAVIKEHCITLRGLRTVFDSMSDKDLVKIAIFSDISGRLGIIQEEIRISRSQISAVEHSMMEFLRAMVGPDMNPPNNQRKATTEFEGDILVSQILRYEASFTVTPELQYCFDKIKDSIGLLHAAPLRDGARTRTERVKVECRGSRATR